MTPEKAARALPATIRGAVKVAARDARAALVELAFGTISNGLMHRGTHLAMLPSDTLELDLSDPAQRHFGNYELLELIGEGGMGVVYRARQINLNREVAVKLLAAGPWASREFVERFLREAQHAASMQHPNIVTVYEVGSAEDLHFFSMRIVRGDSLALAVHQQGPFSSRHAAQLMRTIAEAVDYAHRLGVLHLDLKPANVLLDENGVPHVADFGLARQLDRMQAIDNTEMSGTPSYMAPEQAELGGAPLTAATDIWGLGAILYELVTGHPPFRGSSAQETIHLLRTAQVRRPRRSRPDLPLDLESIILKCLAREPPLRYATARDLGDDLARFCEHREVRARPLNAFQRIGRWAVREPRLAATAVLATALLLVGLATTAQQWQRAEGNAAVSSQRLWEIRRDAAMRQQLDGNGFRALPGLLANIEEIEAHGQANTARIERREVGAILNRGVRLIDRMLIADATPMATALSPDGSMLVIALNDLTVRWFDTRNLQELGRVDLAGLPTSDGSMRVPRLLRFTGNGRLRVTLDWVDYWSSPIEGNTYLIDLDQARIIEPPDEFPDWQESFFSPDGHYALLRSETEIQLWQVDPWISVSPLMPAAGVLSNTAPWVLGPDARYLFQDGDVGFAVASSNLRDLSFSRLDDIPPDTKIAAHAMNSSGSQIALGDTQGRMFVVDTSNNDVRQLSVPVGSRVTWMAYSEDDAWVAAVRRDGSTFAFDAETGIAVNAGLMQCEFEPLQVQLSHRARVLVASGERGIAIWRLPAPGPAGLESTRLLAQPETGLAGTNAVSLSALTGLLATATLDGEVRLWRIPTAPLLPAQSAMQIAGNLQFDGEHLVDVAGSQLRVISLRNAPVTPWTELGQPPGFAELVGDGQTLVATVGNRLHVFDAASMQLRYPIITLPANPLHLVVSEDGKRLAMSFAGTGTDGFVEHLKTLDLGNGLPGPSDVTVKGPLRQLEFSTDGRRLLATGPAGAAITIFDSADLRALAHVAQDMARPVLWARFDSTRPGEQVWLLARDADDARADEAELVAWNLSTGEQGERRRIPGVFPIGLGMIYGQPIVAARDRIMLDPATPRSRSQIYLSRGEATAVMAVSHDRQLIAQAIGRDVQLYDGATLSPVGSPLPSNLGAYDFPAQLAFSPDDHRLLGRSLLSGEWLLWNVESDTRALGELRRDAALLEPVHPGRHVLQVPDAAQQQRLRHNDSGAWWAVETRPQLPVARLLGGIPIPARPPELSPLLLDLTAAYTIAPLGVRNVAVTVLAAPTQLPFGLAHFGDIDFDVRGAIELRWEHGYQAIPGLISVPDKATAISVPSVPIAAFHVLLHAAQDGAEPAEREYAYLRLHYQDGSSALLPMRTQREVPGLSDRDRPVPMAWVRSDHLYLLGYRNQTLIGNPRLPNPHPERLIRSLDIESATTFWSEPVVFAITAEPVIDDADSRIDRDGTGLK